MNKVLSIPHSPVFYIRDNPYLPCSAAIKFHNIATSTCTPQFLHTRKTEHICHAQYSNYIAVTHNVAHSKCTSTCTTHPALPIPLPSTTLLCTQLTDTKHICVSGGKMACTRCRDGVKVLWCHSHLVWLVFEGPIPTCTCFHAENFLWLYK